MAHQISLACFDEQINFPCVCHGTVGMWAGITYFYFSWNLSSVLLAFSIMSYRILAQQVGSTLSAM